MRKTIEVAALGLSLCLGSLSLATHTRAQDPEEGAVDLNETSRPARPAAATPEPERNGPAWETPPSGREGEEDDEDDEPSAEPKEREAGPGKWRLYAGARLGVGGTFREKGANFASVARVTPGIQLGADYLLHKYFGLGLETRLAWAAPKVGNGFNYMIWDLSVKPRVNYRLKARPIEVYLAVPGGLSVNKPGQSYENGKVGASVGIYAGANYFFNDSWALNAELGWTWTFLRYESLRSIPAPPGTGLPPTVSPVDPKVTLGQLTLLAINALYAF